MPVRVRSMEGLGGWGKRMAIVLFKELLPHWVYLVQEGMGIDGPNLDK